MDIGDHCENIILAALSFDCVVAILWALEWGMGI